MSIFNKEKIFNTLTYVEKNLRTAEKICSTGNKVINGIKDIDDFKSKQSINKFQLSKKVLEILNEKEERSNNISKETSNNILESSKSLIVNKNKIFEFVKENINTENLNNIKNTKFKNNLNNLISDLKEEYFKRKQAEITLNDFKIVKNKLEVKLKEYQIIYKELESKKNTPNNNLNIEFLEVKKNYEELNKDYINLKENINYQESLINDASEEIKEKEQQLKNQKNIIKMFNNENELLKEELFKLKNKTDNKEKKLKKDLQKRWSIYFKDFIIEPNVLKVASKLSQEYKYHLDKALMELHNAKDKRSLSRGKIIDNGIEHEHMEFNSFSNCPGRIVYDVLKNSDKSVKIIKIYKHNSKYMS